MHQPYIYTHQSALFLMVLLKLLLCFKCKTSPSSPWSLLDLAQTTLRVPLSRYCSVPCLAWTLRFILFNIICTFSTADGWWKLSSSFLSKWVILHLLRGTWASATELPLLGFLSWHLSPPHPPFQQYWQTQHEFWAQPPERKGKAIH